MNCIPLGFRPYSEKTIENFLLLKFFFKPIKPNKYSIFILLTSQSKNNISKSFFIIKFFMMNILSKNVKEFCCWKHWLNQRMIIFVMFLQSKVWYVPFYVTEDNIKLKICWFSCSADKVLKLVIIIPNIFNTHQRTC